MTVRKRLKIGTSRATLSVTAVVYTLWKGPIGTSFFLLSCSYPLLLMSFPCIASYFLLLNSITYHFGYVQNSDEF